MSAVRRALATGLVWALAGAAPAMAGTCETSPSWPAASSEPAEQVVALVNEHRRELGLAELAVTPPLTAAGEFKARHMAAYGYMDHDDPGPPVSQTVGERLAACGYPAGAGWGENIAMGYPTPAAVVDAWLRSPGHRANIEQASYRAIGVGAARASDGTWYWAQEFGTSTAGAQPTAPPAAPPAEPREDEPAPVVAPAQVPAATPPVEDRPLVRVRWQGRVLRLRLARDARVVVRRGARRSVRTLQAGTHRLRVPRGRGRAARAPVRVVVRSEGAAAVRLRLRASR